MSCVYTENGHFTKTGLGETSEKLRKEVFYAGRFHEWADYGQGFTGIRYAQTNTLSLPKTFQVRKR